MVWNNFIAGNYNLYEMQYFILNINPEIENSLTLA